MTEKVLATTKAPEAKSNHRTRKSEKSESPSSFSLNSPVDHVMSLQRTVGNLAVQRLIEKLGFGGQKSVIMLQAKLKVGQPNDIYEHEAYRVADEVMQMPEPKNAAISEQRSAVSYKNENVQMKPGWPVVKGPSCGEEEFQTKPLASQITPLIQRQEDEDEQVQSTALIQRQEEKEEVQIKSVKGGNPEVSHDVQSQIDILRGGNQPLEKSVRNFFETRFGMTLSNERIHADSIAASAAESIQAKSSTDGKLQFKQVEKDDDIHDQKVAASVESCLSSARGGGSSLPENIQTEMESAFNSDFRGVKIHTGHQAEQMNQVLGAKAFTNGSDIYFNSNQYNPHSNSGRKLLAHELTHVVQQSGGKIRRNTQASRGLKKESVTLQKNLLQLDPDVTAVNGLAEVAAGRNSRVRFRATAPRGTNISWSIQGANPTGAVLGGSTTRTNTLSVPAASTGGTITIRAADAGNAGDSAVTDITLVEVPQPTFVLAPVPAVIQPVGAAFPANTVEASVCGNNATATAVSVPAGRPPVTWRIVGNRRGATIDPATGVITPSVTQTGNIRIRATDSALRAARNEQTISVRAHPRRIRRTIRTGTTAAAGVGTYGSVYDHIFQSSGGNLNGVNVGERVFCGSDPFNFCPLVPIPVPLGLPNVWTLNPAGRMVGDLMWTGSGVPGIDVNRFLPSPPNAGLPQVLTTPQILYWRSEQCGQWVPFQDIPIQFILRRRRGGGFETVTINNGVAAPPEAYTGPALAAGGAPAGSVCPAGTSVSRIRFSPRTIAADGSALTTTAATARVRPGGSGITWSFPGQNFGAVIAAQGNPALLSAGNIAGPISVRAALTATPGCFSEGRLNMREVQIGPIRFNPGSARTTGNTRARVTTRPGSRVVTWTIEGPNLGAVIATNPDNSATITAGAQLGRITIRATDQRDVTKFTETSLAIR